LLVDLEVFADILQENTIKKVSDNMNKWEFIKNNYIDKGLKIFPVIPNKKTPMIEQWLEDCSYDYFQVLYWYTTNNKINIGLPATPNNLFILDLDVHNENANGVENFKKLINNISNAQIELEIEDYCDTLIQKTPSGGMHIIYKTNDRLKNVLNNSNIFKDYPGIDCRTQGYIVVEPSSIDDRYYKFINNENVNEMPKELEEYILNNTLSKDTIKKEPYEKPKNVEIGDRDNQLYSYINNIYYKTRLDYDEILCLANHFNETILEEPFPEKVVSYKVKKVFDKDRGTMFFINVGE